MQWITDITRKNICDVINNSPMLLISAMKIFSSGDKNINFEILLIDYYNTLMVRKNMQTLDADDLKLLELINNNKVEDLKFLINNLNFIRNSFIATVNFETLAMLDKHQITRISYQEKEDNDLTNRPLYKLNFLANNLSYDEYELIKYYKEYIGINGDNLINHDSARDIIFNHLQEIKENDFENYKLIVTSALAAYYKFGQYILSKNRKEIDTTDKIFLRRIRVLKLEDLLTLTKYDNEFLNHIITQYLYFETLPKDVIDEAEACCSKKLSKKMKRKIENMTKNKTTRN